MQVQAAEEIKARVTVEDVLQRYGYDEPDRHGFLSCPLHSGDGTPSFKVYPEGKGWYCFGCHKGGDVITLTRELFHISFQQAILRLDCDFGLGVTGRRTDHREQRRIQSELRKKQKEKEQKEKEYIEKETEFFQLCAIYRAGPQTGDPWPWCQAVERLERLEYWLTSRERR